MKKQISVVRKNIQQNSRNNNDMLPVIRCFDGDQIIEGNSLKLVKDGEVVARFVYNVKRPGKGGATVWLETDLEIQK